MYSFIMIIAHVVRKSQKLMLKSIASQKLKSKQYLVSSLREVSK